MDGTENREAEWLGHTWVHVEDGSGPQEVSFGPYARLDLENGLTVTAQVSRGRFMVDGKLGPERAKMAFLVYRNFDTQPEVVAKSVVKGPEEHFGIAPVPSRLVLHDALAKLLAQVQSNA